MSDKVFVDTNILIYAHDRSMGAKFERAQTIVDQIWNSGGGVLSTQVLQELAVTLRRKIAQPFSLEDTQEIIADYLSWEVVVNSKESVLEAMRIESRHQLSFWDALIVHAAETAGAEILYSEGLSDGQLYGSVRVVNPLK